MDLEKLEKLAKLVLEDVSDSSISNYSLIYYPHIRAKVKNLMSAAYKCLPEYKELFTFTVDSSYPYQARSIIEHLLEIIGIERESEAKIKEGRIFESANEKLKQAGISFQNNDYSSTIHNLNTSLELVLKDKIGIPTTITTINTSTIIDILAKYKVETYLYLLEAKKHILGIDNKIKHQGYSPSKIDCINGIKAMEELISKLRDKEIKLTDEVKNKIYEGL